jgi:hypothetical protein
MMAATAVSGSYSVILLPRISSDTYLAGGPSKVGTLSARSASSWSKGQVWMTYVCSLAAWVGVMEPNVPDLGPFGPG